MIPADRTQMALAQVARELAELGIQAVFLGGATLPLLVAESTRIDLRLTKDIDCVVEVASHSDWEAIALVLRNAGWMPSLAHDDPNCRFRRADLVLDLMPVPETGVGPDNPWFEEGIQRAETVRLDHIKRSYYGIARVNPTGIIPKGPQVDFTAPPDRAL